MPQWLRFYKGNGGDLTKLTVSSDASITSPHNLFRQIRACVVKNEFTLEEVLPLVTTNTARALKLGNKGALKEGSAADILILDREKLEIRDLFSNGKHLFKEGKPAFRETFLKDSNRNIRLKGDKA